jgi:hypothetical protein
MSRRHLTFVVVAIASLAASACNSSPTGPRPTTSAHDEVPVCDPTSIGTAGSSGRC